MVFIAPADKPPEDNSKVYEYTHNYDFQLSNWQLWAIDAILNKNDVLVCAPTGSGKTLPAEFAIEYFVKIGKKVIYTSPIKALSNYMKENFQNKFPDISFGIVTGDNKDNPDADCIICTTECLRNYLFSNQEHQSDLNFDVQIEKEVGIIIYDEAHYFNDPDRGSVWESCFIKHKTMNVQKLLMSATLHLPEQFGNWLQEKTCPSNSKVCLCQTNTRAVPLEHYMFVTSHPSFSNKLTDKKLISSINEIISCPLLLKKNNQFQEMDFQKVKKILNHLSKNNIFVKRQYVLNNIVDYLKKNDKLPAILFVYSRKGVEVMANEITQNLHSEESFPSIVEKEAENILRSKLSNYKEYTTLSEYEFLIKLLKKGIAIHHAGMIQILRELVEKMFLKGFVKLLVATETFAVGINLPCKTTLFPNLMKWDGSSNRFLKGHEYTQQAGRAGRRGFDTKGEAYHLMNLFSEIPTSSEYTTILEGKPQILASKFKISYEIILNVLMIDGKENNNILNFANSSMITNEISKDLEYYQSLDNELQNELSQKQKSLSYLNTKEEILKEYLDLKDRLPLTKKKAKKTLERQMDSLKLSKTFDKDLELYLSIKEIKKKIQKNSICIENTQQYIQYNIEKVYGILAQEEFINKDSNLILEKGFIAHGIKEVHCLAFADSLFNFNYLESLTSNELIAYLSIFTNINVKDDYKSFVPNSYSKTVNQIVNYTKSKIEYYQDLENKNEIYTRTPDFIQFDLLPYIDDWCNSLNEIECKSIIEKMSLEKEIFLGDFIKAILKINNIAQELDCICNSITNKQNLQVKLKDIPKLTLKFVVTNNSLYI